MYRTFIELTLMFFGMCFVLLGVMYFFMARAAIIISYLLKQERGD